MYSGRAIARPPRQEYVVSRVDRVLLQIIMANALLGVSPEVAFLDRATGLQQKPRLQMNPQFGPALILAGAKEIHRLEGNPCFRVGRSPDADLSLLDPACSRRQFQIVCENGTHYLETLSTTSPTFCNGKPVTERTRLDDDAVIRAGQSQFQFVAVGRPIGAPPPDLQPTAIGGGDANVQLAGSIPLSAADTLIGRDPSRANITLPHVQVSRVHARIKIVGPRALLADLNSANGTFVNGRRLVLPTMVNPGDQIVIGPYTLVFTGEALLPQVRVDNAQLVGRNLSRVVCDHSTGRSMTILDGVNLVARPREFVCLLGPSGSGKTTLLSVLSARSRADSGSVLLNQWDLYANFDSLKRDLAVVPQRDILHEQLTVEDALRYTAQLRLPPDTSPAEINRVVEETLSNVGLTDRGHVQLRHLSGGQRKRASLANELISNPSLLFLDEVTSGLDEQSDAEMMGLFRSVAERGKTVICVTHSLANVAQACHLVVILTPGGKLAFCGRPDEALEYFQISRLGEVYERLAEREPDDWQSRFARSEYCGRYVGARLPPEAPESHAAPAGPAGDWGRQWQDFQHQLPVLARRYLQVLLADRKALLGTLIQSLLVALLLILVFGRLDTLAANDPQKPLCSANLLFMMAVSCFWFGCNNSAKEMIKERAIYLKERQVNLHVSAYYASKLLLQTILAAVQSSLLFALVWWFCRVPGNSLGQWLLLLLTATAGTALGLLISSLASSEEVAVTMVPMVLLPQIILADAFKVLDGVPRTLARVVTLYWSYGGLRRLLPDDLIAYLAAAPTAIDKATIMIAAHVVVLISAALAVLYLRDR